MTLRETASIVRTSSAQKPKQSRHIPGSLFYVLAYYMSEKSSLKRKLRSRGARDIRLREFDQAPFQGLLFHSPQLYKNYNSGFALVITKSACSMSRTHRMQMHP